MIRKRVKRGEGYAFVIIDGRILYRGRDVTWGTGRGGRGGGREWVLPDSVNIFVGSRVDEGNPRRARVGHAEEMGIAWGNEGGRWGLVRAGRWFGLVLRRVGGESVLGLFPGAVCVVALRSATVPRR